MIPTLPRNHQSVWSPKKLKMTQRYPKTIRTWYQRETPSWSQCSPKVNTKWSRVVLNYPQRNPKVTLTKTPNRFQRHITTIPKLSPNYPKKGPKYRSCEFKSHLLPHRHPYNWLMLRGDGLFLRTFSLGFTDFCVWIFRPMVDTSMILEHPL